MKFLFSVVVSILLVGAGFQHEAHASAAYCAPPREAVLTDTQTTLKQNFFFRAFPDGKRVAFAAADGGKKRFLNPLKVITIDQGAHFLLDLTTGETKKLSESDMDPVNVGHDILTSPSVRWGLRFFYLPDLVKGLGEKKASLTDDRKMSGEYQSVGLMNGGTVARIMISSTQQTATFRDYEIRRLKARPEIIPVGDEKPACSNLSMGQFRTPMISKDGQYVGYFKTDRARTVIAKLNAQTGHCEDVIELPVGTGKVDFSYPSTEEPLVTFHMDSAQKSLGKWKRTPPKNQVLDIFVYNLTSKKLAKVTHNLKDNSWYPNFTEDRRVIFSHHGIGKGYSSFRTASLADLAWVDFDSDAPNVHRQSWIALGRLFYRACAEIDQVQPHFAELAARSLTRAQCEALVQAEWPIHRNGVFDDFKRDGVVPSNLFESEVQVRELCAGAREAKPMVAATVVRGSGFAIAQDAAGGEGLGVLQAKCQACHSRGPQKIDFLLAKSDVRLFKKLSCRVSLPESDPRHMPPQGSLSQSEQQALARFFGRTLREDDCKDQ